MATRNVQVKIRMTQAEHFQLVRTAQDAGSNVSAFVRRCCLSKEHVTVINRGLIRDIHREIRRIGTNINQLAHIANTDRRISEIQIRQLLAWQRELVYIVQEKFDGIKR